MKNLNLQTTIDNTIDSNPIESNMHVRVAKTVATTTKQTFIYDFVCYLKDSNAYGNNYFAKYFEWQGICREAWFYNCVASDFLQEIGVFITKSAHNEYKRETFPFQKIRCFVNAREILNASFYLDFCFCDPKDENIVFAKGYQQIVFADKSRKITKLPSHILEIMRQYTL